MRILMGIMDDGSGVIGRRTLPLIGTTRIGCLMDRIRPTHTHRFGIIRIVHFTDIADIIMDTVRRIIATIAVIILTETFIGGITVAVGIHRFHGGLTKKAICGLKIGVLGVHAV